MNTTRAGGATQSVTRSQLVLLAAVALALFAGCETMSQAEQGEVIGGVIGGVVGAQVGDGSGQTAAIIIGTLAGAMIGRHIGETMDDVDRMRTARTLNDSRTGQSTTWVNPDSGYEYTVTPTKTYEQSGGPCREFSLNATVGGQPDQEVYGTACLQADGSWLVQ
jgi:surface antigen